MFQQMIVPTNIETTRKYYATNEELIQDIGVAYQDVIKQAAKYIPLERLCLSPQCGFASCEIGNKLTEEQQWAKLALVKEIAEEVWG